VSRGAARWAALLLAALLVRSGRLFQPWSLTEDWGAMVSVLARNYLRHGPGPRGLPYVEAGPTGVGEGAVYSGHPPLVPLLVAGAFATLGATELVARAVPLALSLLCVVLLWRVARPAWGRRGAFLAALLFATLPLPAFHGALVDFQGWAPMAGLLLATLARRPTVIAGLVVLATLADWPGALGGGLFALFWACQGERTRALGALAGAAAGLGLAAVLLRTGATGGSLWDYVAFKLGPAGFAKAGLLDWLGRMTVREARWFTPIALLLAAAAAAGARAPQRRLIAPWLAFAAAYVTLAPEPAAFHDYWSLYLAIPVALAAAATLRRVAAWSRRTGRAGVLATALLSATLFWCGANGAGLYREAKVGTAVARDLGRWIRERTAEDAAVLSPSPGSWALTWYADRRMVWSVRSPEDLLRRRPASGPGTLVLTGPEAAEHPALLELARAHFPERREGGVRLFDLAAALESLPAFARPGGGDVAAPGPPGAEREPGGLRLSWNAVAGAADYLVRPNPGAPVVPTGGATSLLLPEALLPAGRYEVRVAAVDARGRSGPESAPIVVAWRIELIRRGLATIGALTLAAVGLALLWQRGRRLDPGSGRVR